MRSSSFASRPPRLVLLVAALFAARPAPALARKSTAAQAQLVLSVEGGGKGAAGRTALLVALENAGPRELWVNGWLSPSPGHRRGPVAIELTDDKGKTVELDCARGRRPPRRAFRKLRPKERIVERIELGACAVPPGSYRARATFQELTAAGPPPPSGVIKLGWALVSNDVTVTIPGPARRY